MKEIFMFLIFLFFLLSLLNYYYSKSDYALTLQKEFFLIVLILSIIIGLYIYKKRT